MRIYLRNILLLCAFAWVSVAGAQQDSTFQGDTVFEFNKTLRFYRDTLGNDSVLKDLVRPYRFQTDYNLDQIDPPVYGEPVARSYFRNQWRFIVIGLLMLFIGLARLTAPGILVRYFKAFFKPKALEGLLSEQDSEIGSFGTLLAFFTSLIYALPLQYLVRMEGYSLSYYAWGEYVLLALIVFVLFLVKLSLQAVLGRIMEMRDFVAAYLYAAVTLNFGASVLLIPAFLVLLLNHWLVVDSSLILLVFSGALLLVLVKILRSVSFAGNTLIYSPFYLILYLCALEILPWLVIYRLLTLT